MFMIMQLVFADHVEDSADASVGIRSALAMACALHCAAASDSLDCRVVDALGQNVLF